MQQFDAAASRPVAGVVIMQVARWQPECAGARLEQAAVGEQNEPAGPATRGQRKAEVRTDAGRFAAGDGEGGDPQSR
jgi:hypothetical protein